MYCFVVGEEGQSSERANKPWELGSNHTVNTVNSSVHRVFLARTVADMDSPGDSDSLHYLELS